MRAFLLPSIGIGTIERPIRSAVPDSVHARPRGWGQMSSMILGNGTARGKLVYVRGGSSTEFDEMLKNPLAADFGQLCDDAVTEKMHAALSTPFDRFDEYAQARADLFKCGDKDALAKALAVFQPLSDALGDFHRDVIEDFVGTYRGLAEKLEAEELAKPEILNAYDVVSSDNFVGTANAEMNGRTMDQGGGGAADVWTVKGGNSKVKIGTNNAVSIDLSGDTWMYDGTASAIADQRASVDYGSSQTGAVIAFVSAGNFFLCYRSAGNKTVLYDNSAGSYTQIGSDGATTVNNGDIGQADRVGTTLNALLNGVVEVGPQTSSLHATGVGGGYLGAQTNILDTFLWEKPAAASGAIPRSLIINQAVNRASTY